MTIKLELNTIGARVNYAMHRRDLRQIDLAGKMGISQQQLSAIITTRKDVTTKTLVKLCKALDVSADWLLDCEADHEPL